MAPAVPSRNQLKCSGCSFIISQILAVITVSLYSIDYDLYDVDNEEKVIELHNLLSSQQHRTEIEIAVSLTWLTFPLYISGLYGVKSLLEVIYQDTGARFLLYLAEKAFLMFILVVTILIPASSLASVSFEWSFHEYTPDNDFIPTGYYIQLYSNILTMELIDCVAIAWATFLISLFIAPRFFCYDNARFRRLKSLMDPDLPKCLKDMHCCLKCINIMFFGLALSSFIIFCFVIFEFAESGFFSPSGHAKFLTIWAFIIQFMIGLRLFHVGCSKHYDILKEVFEGEEKLLETDDDDDDEDDAYKMEKLSHKIIEIEANDKQMINTEEFEDLI